MNLSNLDTLRLWHLSAAWLVRHDMPDLTLRQLTILLHVYLTPAPHTVRGLASSLNLSKAAVSRALDRLQSHSFIKRKTDKEDRRNIFIQRTIAGSVFLTDINESLTPKSQDIAQPA